MSLSGTCIIRSSLILQDLFLNIGLSFQKQLLQNTRHLLSLEFLHFSHTLVLRFMLEVMILSLWTYIFNLTFYQQDDLHLVPFCRKKDILEDMLSLLSACVRKSILRRLSILPPPPCVTRVLLSQAPRSFVPDKNLPSQSPAPASR